MDTLNIVGWAATIFIIISFLINNMLWLRIINMVGAALWLTYGIIDTSYSIIFLNVIIVSIQFFKISLLLKDKNLNRQPELYSGAADYDFLCQIVDSGIFISRIPESIGYNYIFNDKQATWEMHKDPINYDKIIQSKWRDKWSKF